MPDIATIALDDLSRAANGHIAAKAAKRIDFEALSADQQTAALAALAKHDLPPSEFGWNGQQQTRNERQDCTAANAVAELLAARPGLLFCGCDQKGRANEKDWHTRTHDAVPDRWRGCDWFAIQPHSAGTYLVDLDEVTDEARILGNEPGRSATAADAKELAGIVGGKPRIYASTPGKGKYHLLYPAADNGGLPWNLASQGGLMARLRSGELAVFDVRGGGVYPDGDRRAGRQCGCRIDADARRIGKLLAVQGDSALEAPDMDRLAAALDRRQLVGRRVKDIRRPRPAARQWRRKQDGETKPVELSPYGGTGVHDHIIAQTLRIADAPTMEHERLLTQLERECEGLPRKSGKPQDLRQEIRNAYNGANRR